MTGFLKYAVQSAAMFETRFNSVERLMAYMTLPQEAPRFIKDTQCALTPTITSSSFDLAMVSISELMTHFFILPQSTESLCRGSEI